MNKAINFIELTNHNTTYGEFLLDTSPRGNVDTFYVIPQYLIDHETISNEDIEQHITEMKSKVETVTVVEYNIDEGEILCTNGKKYRHSNGWEIEEVNDTGVTRIVPNHVDLDYYIRVNVLRKILEFQFSSYDYQLTLEQMRQVYSIVKNKKYS